MRGALRGEISVTVMRASGAETEGEEEKVKWWGCGAGEGERKGALKGDL